MKKFFLYVAIIIGNASVLFPQLNEELKTEVISYIKHNLMDFPDIETDAINIENKR